MSIKNNKKNNKIKTCIQNKKLPKDIPPYLKKAFGRATRKYQDGIKYEISVLDNFAEKKNVIEGEPAIMPIDFF